MEKKNPINDVKLKVAEAIQDDVNKGIVRIDNTFMQQIGIRVGDIVEIEGERKTVAIADGCSGSILSDIGSRVLSITAMNKMSELKTLHDIDEQELILLARPSVKVLNLPPECLDATLLCAAKIDLASDSGPRPNSRYAWAPAASTDPQIIPHW